jgi:hypothetical protein
MTAICGQPFQQAFKEAEFLETRYATGKDGVVTKTRRDGGGSFKQAVA